jgi:Protein of unknown function (DUF3570)
LLKSLRFGMPVLVMLGIGFGYALAGQADFKYLYYWDRNGVWNHTPAFLLAGNPWKSIQIGWEQELDVVSGASRELGLRQIGGLGDHDLLVDGLSGASKKELRYSEKVDIAHERDGNRVGASVVLSDEADYVSRGVGVSGSIDFNERNTTLSGEWSFYSDDFHPQGAFIGLGGEKTIQSFSMSLFQILSEYSLAGLSADYIRSEGYLGHPYLPVITETGALVREAVPDRRHAMALSSTWIQGYRVWERLGSVHLLLGYFEDDWRLRSISAEWQWYQYFLPEWYVRLRSRWYGQSRAAFVREVYTGRETYRSVDIRYSEFQSVSFGAQIVGSLPFEVPGWIPSQWNISYDQGMRDVRGELGTGKPTYRYQLFSSEEFYREGTWMLGFGYRW